MSRNGSGTYQAPSGSFNPATNGNSATAADWNTLLADLVAAMTQSVSADGQTPITGNFNMGNNKLTALAAGSATGQSLAWQQLFSQGSEADIPSAATVDIGLQNTNFLRITGTTTITSFGANLNGPRFIRFAGSLTLTYNATTLILPGAVNIITAAGDSCIAAPVAGGWQVVAYQRAFGLNNGVVSVKDFGVVGDGVADDTLAFVDAFAESDVVYAPQPEVSYRLSSLVLGNNKKLITDGFASVFHQLTGQPVGTRMFVIAGSNVELGSMTVRGNIATDTDEQNHSVFVQANATTGNLQNITIGDIAGQDVRGDVLYIGATTGYLTSALRFGRITGSNILRSICSIVGGAYITGDAVISTGATGYWALAIEPNTVTCHDIAVNVVKGASFGCVPPLVANAAYNINIGLADIDPSFAPQTTPPYAARNIRSGLHLRNIRSFNIDILKVKDHTHFAVEYIWNGGEQRGQGIRIGFIDSDNVGSGETLYNCAILALGVDHITIGDSRVNLNDTLNDTFILGDTSGSTFTRAIIDRCVVNGRAARYIRHGRFSNIFANTASATSVFNRVDDCTILDSDITVPTLISFANRCTFVNTKAICSTAYYGSSVADTTRINCEFGAGNVVGFATQRQTSDSLSGEVSYGSQTTATVGGAGGAAALPATPRGYIVVSVAGVARKIPFFDF